MDKGGKDKGKKDLTILGKAKSRHEGNSKNTISEQQRGEEKKKNPEPREKVASSL